MDADAGDHAVSLLSRAATTGQRLEALPPRCKPATVVEALAIQERLVADSGGAVAGYKVATDSAGAIMYGAIYADDCYASPATINSARYPLLGIEGEIAYRFGTPLPARDAPYSRSELEAVLIPFPAIEVVDSRYADYRTTPLLDRLADRMSNGAMVLGTGMGGRVNFEDFRVTLTVDGVTMVDQRGGHARKDPFLPAMDLIHTLQKFRAFAAGQFVTTGTFTGLVFGRAGQTFAVEFHGFGRAALTIAALESTEMTPLYR